MTEIDLSASVSALDAEEMRAQVRALTGQYEALLVVVAGLEARIPEPVPVPDRPGIGNAFAENAETEAWDELIGWVDWLIATYDLVPARQIKPCWLNHPGAVEELAALYAAWRVAAGQGGSAMATWHGLHLTGVLARLETSYLISRCKPDKCEQPRAALPTHRPADY